MVKFCFIVKKKKITIEEKKTAWGINISREENDVVKIGGPTSLA